MVQVTSSPDIIAASLSFYAFSSLDKSRVQGRNDKSALG